MCFSLSLRLSFVFYIFARGNIENKRNIGFLCCIVDMH